MVLAGEGGIVTAYSDNLNRLHESGLSMCHSDICMRIVRALPSNAWALPLWGVNPNILKEHDRERMRWACESVARTYRNFFLNETEVTEKIS